MEWLKRWSRLLFFTRFSILIGLAATLLVPLAAAVKPDLIGSLLVLDDPWQLFNVTWASLVVAIFVLVSFRLTQVSAAARFLDYRALLDPIGAGKHRAVGNHADAEADSLPQGAIIPRRTAAFWRADKRAVESAKMKSAKITSAGKIPANMASANMMPTNMASANIGSANIQSASIQSASIQSASIQSASIQPANIQPASIQSASIQSASIQSATCNRPISRRAASVRPIGSRATKHSSPTTAQARRRVISCRRRSPAGVIAGCCWRCWASPCRWPAFITLRAISRRPGPPARCRPECSGLWPWGPGPSWPCCCSVCCWSRSNCCSIRRRSRAICCRSSFGPGLPGSNRCGSPSSTISRGGLRGGCKFWGPATRSAIPKPAKCCWPPAIRNLHSGSGSSSRSISTAITACSRAQYPLGKWAVPRAVLRVAAAVAAAWAVDGVGLLPGLFSRAGLAGADRVRVHLVVVVQHGARLPARSAVQQERRFRAGAAAQFGTHDLVRRLARAAANAGGGGARQGAESRPPLGPRKCSPDSTKSTDPISPARSAWSAACRGAASARCITWLAAIGPPADLRSIPNRGSG